MTRPCSLPTTLRFLHPGDSDFPRQMQDEQDDQGKAQPAARTISPCAAVGPGGQRAEQHYDHDDNNERGEHGITFGPVMARLASSPPGLVWSPPVSRSGPCFKTSSPR